MNFLLLLTTFVIVYYCYLINVITACPQIIASVCKCSADGSGIRVDCSQLTLVDAVKKLEESGAQVRLLEIHDNNNIRDIPAKLFSKLVINQLDLSNNYIARVDPNAFVGQEESLTDVNLSNNSLPLVPNFSLLKNLENLDLSGNTIADVRENAFANNQKLKTFRIERNKICNLAPNALNETKQVLELLDISNNCFSTVPAANLRNFQRLEYLDLSANKINDVANLQIMNMPSLKELRLNDNNINNIYPLAFMNVPNLELLNLARNKLPVLDTSRFQSFDNLAVLDLTGNKLTKVPTNAYTNMKSLRQIMLDDNNITSVETLAFSSLPTLQLISLQNNFLSQLFRNAFDSLPAAQVLLLANNKLQSLDAGMLSGMPVLQQLNLHNNNISTLQPNAFDPLPQLTTLDLGKNQIENIPVDLFKKLTKLFWLDLSQNLIKSFEVGTFGAKISNMVLQGNPWECDAKLDWFVRYLVANNVRTFLPGQPEVICAGPQEYAGTLLKDLMIKKANETFFKTFGAYSGAQGLFGSSLNSVPGLNSLFGGGDGSANGLLDSLATPINGMVEKGLVTDLVKSLPALLANLPKPGSGAIAGGPGAANGGGTGDGSLPNIDFSKVPPGVIQYVMNGGQIPGISQETMQRLIQQYLQQMAKTLPINTSPPQSTAIGTKSANGSKQTITESMPLPPLSSIPPELVQRVLSGGLIPGMTKEQTEAIKQRYIDQMVASSGKGTVITSGSPLSLNASASLLSLLPSEILLSVNLSQISPEVLTDLANGRVPDLNKVSPDLVQILINKRPDLFGRMVDKLLQNKIDAGVANDSAFAGRLPPTQQAPVQVTGHPYDVNDLDNKADLGYYDQHKGDKSNLGLWTGLGFGVVGILTTATILFLCYRRRKARRSQDADGTKFFSTPRSSSNTLIPVQNNNNMPPFLASSSTRTSFQSDLEYCKPSALDYSKPSGLDYSKPSSVDYCKPSPASKSWMFESGYKKTEM